MNNNIIQKNYKKLYEKYKYKYIKLKMKDKTVITSNEITNITKQLYLKKDFIPLIEKYIRNITTNNNSNILSQQPCILLKNIYNDPSIKPINYTIEINKENDLNGFCKVDIHPINEKDYNNKIILSSNNQTGGANNTIFYLKNTTPEISEPNYPNYPSYQTHMDNCMCFMPCGT